MLIEYRIRFNNNKKQMFLLNIDLYDNYAPI